jgi:hypothetical protein
MVRMPSEGWLEDISGIELKLLLGDEEGLPLAFDRGLRWARCGLWFGGRFGSRPTVLGSLFLIIESAEALPVVFGVVWAELLLEILVLLELVLGDVMGLDPEADSGGVPASLNVSFSNGRLFGDVLRTTVGSRGGRNMAFDILCMPDTKTDFFLRPSDELICSTMMGCSEANDTRSA